MDRRGFLKTSLVVGGTALTSNKARAQEQNDPGDIVDRGPEPARSVYWRQTGYNSSLMLTVPMKPG